MIRLIHTGSGHVDFQRLSLELEKELFERDGDLAVVNYELNKVDLMQNAVILYVNNEPVACGAYRSLTSDTVEIKRIYVSPAYRKHGYASQVLAALEGSASENGFKNAVLETGKNQPEAISFYGKHGYKEIEKFGKYVNSINSLCFKKEFYVSGRT